jgi:hypothetical protein
VPPYQTGCKWTKTASPTQRNKKIPKKKSCAGMENHEFDRQAALFNGASMEVIT